MHGREIIDLIRPPLLDRAEHLMPVPNIHRRRFVAFGGTRRATSQGEDCTPVGCKPVEKNASILARAADDEGSSNAA